MLGQAIEVLLLLGKLLLELQELLLLALADGVVLAGPFASLKGITARKQPVSQVVRLDDVCGSRETHPWPPIFGGAPVSPSPMARAVVEKVARRGRRAAALAYVVRKSMPGERGGRADGAFQEEVMTWW